MKRIGTDTSTRRRVWFAAMTVLAGVIASGSLVVAQGSTDRAIDQAQRAVQERIASQQGGRDLTVQFARDAQTEFPSNAQVRVRGTGNVVRATDGRLRPFSYEAVVNTRSNKVIRTQYDWRGEWYSSGRR